MKDKPSEQAPIAPETAFAQAAWKFASAAIHIPQTACFLFAKTTIGLFRGNIYGMLGACGSAVVALADAAPRAKKILLDQPNGPQRISP
ncbi:MAG: hypothetical protein PHE27_03960 [Alphaproteobacteria bacterium]|nr:hypothetical protein [Alphaproteobacteria bacterium]